MESYRELKDLSLSNNYLKSISFLPPLPKIQELKIANNNIESLSVKFKYMYINIDSYKF